MINKLISKIIYWQIKRIAKKHNIHEQFVCIYMIDNYLFYMDGANLKVNNLNFKTLECKQVRKGTLEYFREFLEVVMKK